jgi:hypothetical protein
MLGEVSEPLAGVPTISCSIIGGIPLNASLRRLEARLAV